MGSEAAKATGTSRVESGSCFHPQDHDVMRSLQLTQLHTRMHMMHTQTHILCPLFTLRVG